MIKIYSRFALFSTLMFIFSIFPVSSQLKAPDIELSFDTYVSTGQQNPFWFVSNQYGKYTLSKNAALASVIAQSEADTSGVFDVNYGFELVNRYDGADKFWFNQAYMQMDYHNFIRFKAGLWEESLGNEYTSLSSGSTIWSRNARPMPKIEIGTSGYVEVPYTRGILEVNGALTHGWFETDRYVDGALLHQKYISARSGWDFPLNLNWGLYHFAQWGGEHPSDEKYPTGIKDYLKVFFIRSGSEEAPETFQLNKYGNHLGTRNYGIDWEDETFTAGIYYQDIIEDGSGMRRRNFPDGLWGLYLTLEDQKAPVTGILYEYLQTSDQSGPIHDWEEGLGGNDNYFNHGRYHYGWTFNQMTIGTPFITSPVYNEDVDHRLNYRIWNNRVKVHHFGIEGQITEGLDYKALVSYSKNKGIYDQNYIPEVFELESPLHQWSGKLDLYYELPAIEGLNLGGSMAFDKGRMYGDNWGLMVKVVYGGG